MSAQSHFFIESGGFPQQQSGQEFGPVSETVFNLTSRFTIANTPKKAFSICKGIVLVQPQTSSEDKVNLILRPFTQPFPGLNIKYFVYRGLQKSDFFGKDQSNQDVIISKTSSTSDFINKINDDFDAFYNDNNNIVKPSFKPEFIGYEELPDLTRPLSDFFFKESLFQTVDNVSTETHLFELPLIDSGKTLGNFAKGECGIDVVLNYGDYKHNFDNHEFNFNLKYACEPFSQISINTEETDFEQKLKREQITQFIDIAAYYGLHTKDGSVIVDAAGTKAEKKGAFIYNDLLNPFLTKNNWYIYIQSDRTRSYDFYGNYKIGEGPENLKTGLLQDTASGEVPMTSVKYGTSGWPVLINTQQTGTATTNNLYLQFPTDNNNNTAFYGQIANVANAQKDTFINADGLRLPPDEEGNYVDFTSTIQLTTPTVAGKNIASLSLLIFQGKINLYTSGTTEDENGDLVILYSQANFFDNIFSLINAKPLLQLDSDKSYSRMTSEKLNLINEFYDKKQQGISIVQTLTVNDVIETGIEEPAFVERVTYLTENVDVMNNAASATGSTSSTTYTSPSAGGAVGNSKTYQLPDPYYYSLKLFTDSTETITGLELKTLDGSTPNKIILGLTKEENDSIKSLISEEMTNPRLFLIDLFEDENKFISPENIKYQKYKVVIVAENADGVSKLFEPTENPVFVYSIDTKYHFSKGHSEYMPVITTGIEGDNLIDEQITI